jgi:hypothetical protein
MRRLLRRALVATFLAATGCDGCTKEPGKISVEIRDPHVTHKGQLSLDQGWAAVGEGAAQRKVEVRDGHLRALNKGYGTVAAGDAVVLDEKDVVTVNGHRRDPE